MIVADSTKGANRQRTKIKTLATGRNLISEKWPPQWKVVLDENSQENGNENTRYL